MYFNPRSPRGERLETGVGPLHGGDISIHAPREGSDRQQAADGPVQGHFNPRSPRGERLGERWISLTAKGISIHAPREGSDGTDPPARPRRSISIHAPREGSDEAAEARVKKLAISIHAPREGSDIRSHKYDTARKPFQSTLPARGATRRRERRTDMYYKISIHAPREGSDSRCAQIYICRLVKLQ